MNRFQCSNRLGALLAALLSALGSACFATAYTVTNGNNAGSGSLRQAILDANANPGTDSIDFSVGTGHKVIILTAPLPDITQTVYIFGVTQPGYNNQPLIELNGASAGAGVDGLRIIASDCIVVGLVINRFQGDGMLVTGSRNTVADCFIGTDATGTSDLGNSAAGVRVNGADNVIAGGFALLGTGTGYMVIAGNGGDGVVIDGASAARNAIHRCRIGVNLAGTAVLANGSAGVHITHNAANNVIGDTADAGRNVIAGHPANVRIELGATGNRVIGNSIGTNAAASAALGGSLGVLINNASNNTVGGTTAAEGNVISGNTQQGVHIEGSAAAPATGNLMQGNFIGTNAAGAALGNGASATGGEGAGVAFYNAGGNTVRGNVISANTGQGVSLFVFGLMNPPGNTIAGNFIGTKPGGAAPLGNTSTGVMITDTPNTVVGGSAADRNVISGNLIGVLISDSGGSGGQGANNIVADNFIGTDATGTLDLGNRDAGVSIAGNATFNTVSANVISGNDGTGVSVQGNTSFPAQDNSVLDNLIGTNAAGTAVLPNGGGIGLGSRAQRTLIAGNLVSGNAGDGVGIQGQGITGNILRGNRIGTDAAGKTAIPNGVNGVFVLNGDTAIGQPGNGNVISGNTMNGVFLSGAAVKGSIQGNTIGATIDGEAALANGGSGVRLEGTDGITVGGAGPDAGNTLSGNARNGIEVVAGSTGTLVQGNRIGTDAAGGAPLGNAQYGVLIEQASQNTVGGIDAGAGNLISGNGQSGVFVNATTNNGTQATEKNAVQGNRIGTDADGKAAIPNVLHGVLISDASQNTIGGSAAGAGNLISGNGGDGVQVFNTVSTATGNAILGNVIGLSADGSAVLPNGGSGINLRGSASTGVGAPGAGNTISGNARWGIVLHDKATLTPIQGNVIGTDPTGAKAFGNGFDGVFLENAPQNLVGGLNPGEGNTIAANGGAGVRILDADAHDNTVQGNRIGLDGLGNAQHGVWIKAADNNHIGGADPGAGNAIRANGGDGVYVESGTGNSIRQNAIDANAGLGIDLDADGVSPNDAMDADPGANDLQNFPVLASVTSAGGTTTVTGAFDSALNAAFTLEFFSSSAPDPSGYGEGATYLGNLSVTTDAAGHAAFTASLPVSLAAGRSVTATATSAAGSTSEFSASLLFGALRGDADSDGDVDLDDVRTVLRAGGGLGTAASVPNGDVAPAPNGDGRLDILDAARILRHLANLEPQL